MNARTRWLPLVVSAMLAVAFTEAYAEGDSGFRVLSWNVSEDSFVKQRDSFAGVLQKADPDILLFDEVTPNTKESELRSVLEGLPLADGETWHIDIGVSGGRQRGAIIARAPLLSLQEFSSIVPYPDADRQHILRSMSDAERRYSAYSMDFGIPVNGALVLQGGRRLLVLIVDLQCCGASAESWQEYRRRVEAREIRELVRKVLDREKVDGIVIAGDFNAVNSTIPVTRLLGPYAAPHSGMIPAEVYHQDGARTWTWDGRGTPFPSSALDYQLYSPGGLRAANGLVIDTEDLPAAERQAYGLENSTSRRLSEHRPLLVDYTWHPAPPEVAKENAQ